MTVSSCQKYCTPSSSRTHQYPSQRAAAASRHQRSRASGRHWGGSRLVPLLHHEPLALLIVQIELGNSRGLGCLCVGRLDIAEVLGAGAENEGLNAVVDGKKAMTGKNRIMIPPEGDGWG